jgi:uncharacterized membrane protein YfcA
VDGVNGVFELAGGVFILLNVIRLYRDKKVRGVSPVAIGFFTVWGFWNLAYYPSMSQWASAIGAGGVALVNTVWLGQLIYYSVRERRHDSVS